ncbi:hypothetical protein GCM10009039_23970 [Halocalculus aciditolerans]|uniref:Uncharacterized protein n=1 Tax=Halocalculus aciditolerans TaxID=1383812 RepID=A0A830FKI3_9EURY|nr:hypothetical protein GCM10009039_23970 [Halocalculus aciditolerans]
MLGVIDEEHGVGDVVFLTKLPQKLLRQYCRSRRKQPNMEEFVRFGIDGGYSQNCCPLIRITVSSNAM